MVNAQMSVLLGMFAKCYYTTLGGTCGGARVVAGSWAKTFLNEEIYKYLCIFSYIYYVGKSIQSS